MTLWDSYEAITIGLADELTDFLTKYQWQYQEKHGCNIPFTFRNPLDLRMPILGPDLLSPRQYHRQYVERMDPNGTQVLFLGISPGNNGMGINGIPFGDPASVNNFLNIIPRVPGVSEPSGRRLWGLIKKICGTQDRFFANCFVQNACPILFAESNRHVNPFVFGFKDTEKEIRKEIIGDIQRKILDRCFEALVEVIELLQPKFIVAIGEHAEQMASQQSDVPVYKIKHPSPASPGSDVEWEEEACNDLFGYDIIQIMNPGMPSGIDSYEALMEAISAKTY